MSQLGTSTSYPRCARPVWWTEARSAHSLLATRAATSASARAGRPPPPCSSRPPPRAGLHPGCYCLSRPVVLQEKVVKYNKSYCLSFIHLKVVLKSPIWCQFGRYYPPSKIDGVSAESQYKSFGYLGGEKRRGTAHHVLGDLLGQVGKSLLPAEPWP